MRQTCQHWQKNDPQSNNKQIEILSNASNITTASTWINPKGWSPLIHIFAFSVDISPSQIRWVNQVMHDRLYCKWIYWKFVGLVLIMWFSLHNLPARIFPLFNIFVQIHQWQKNGNAVFSLITPPSAAFRAFLEVLLIFRLVQSRRLSQGVRQKILW